MKVGSIPTEELIGKDIPNRGNSLRERKCDGVWCDSTDHVWRRGNKIGKVHWSCKPRALIVKGRHFNLFCRQSFLSKGVTWALMKGKVLNSDNNTNWLGEGFSLWRAFKDFNSNGIFNIKAELGSLSKFNNKVDWFSHTFHCCCVSIKKTFFFFFSLTYFILFIY